MQKHNPENVIRFIIDKTKTNKQNKGRVKMRNDKCKKGGGVSAPSCVN